MNKIFKIVYLLGFVAMMFASCTPDDNGLGSLINKDDLRFSITQNVADPNMIILESQTPNATAYWNTPFGRMVSLKDTVRIAFPGTYKFVYGVLSKGGTVEADTVNIAITTTNLSYVQDPLWIALSGGVDNEKSWILDTGKYGLAAGPVSFADPSVPQEWGNFTPNWEPDNQGQTDLDMSAIMTFSLKGGPYFKTVKPNEPVGSENGSYSLNVNNHTLSTTNATIIRLASFIDKVSNWSTDVKVLVLNENQLRIAIMRTNEEGPWYYIFNYVSKDYADNYVPDAEPEPELPEGWQNDVSQTVSTTVKWVLSPDTPFNWANLDGSFMNAWNSLAEYPDWTGFNSTVPATYATFSLSFNSENGTVVYIDPTGVQETGTYTLDSKGYYTFTGVMPAFNICSWVNLGTSSDNQWRITKIEKDAVGKISGMWVGVRDAVKAEYMVYHLEQ